MLKKPIPTKKEKVKKIVKKIQVSLTYRIKVTKFPKPKEPMPAKKKRKFEKK
jgi:hypothetical protein